MNARFFETIQHFRQIEIPLDFTAKLFWRDRALVNHFDVIPAGDLRQHFLHGQLVKIEIPILPGHDLVEIGMAEDVDLLFVNPGLLTGLEDMVGFADRYFYAAFEQGRLDSVFVGVSIDVEGGAEDVDLILAGADFEGLRGVFDDFEIGFASDGDFAFFRRESGWVRNGGSRVEPDLGAIGQIQLVLAAAGRAEGII